MSVCVSMIPPSLSLSPPSLSLRYSPEMGELPELAQASLVDILYIDNTYCHPSCQFPSRVSIHILYNTYICTCMVIVFF